MLHTREVGGSKPPAPIRLRPARASSGSLPLICKTVFTIGHSTHEPGTFAALLARHDVNVLVDVRRHPGSRRVPWTNPEQIERALPIAYVHALVVRAWEVFHIDARGVADEHRVKPRPWTASASRTRRSRESWARQRLSSRLTFEQPAEHVNSQASVAGRPSSETPCSSVLPRLRRAPPPVRRSGRRRLPWPSEAAGRHGESRSALRRGQAATWR